VQNVYFDLTAEFNRERTLSILSSGQAVVYYGTAILSKDGDWLVEESDEACGRVRSVLAARGARYRAGAPLDRRWLAGGWSSHFEYRDEKQRRVRCDFLARPPRIDGSDLESLFRSPRAPGELAVIDIENLIRMKRTQRAKDYPVIAELARLLPEDREILYSTDPDRIIALAKRHGRVTLRPPVLEAVRGGSREDVVVALAKEIDALQEADRRRLEAYARTSRPYMEALVRSGHLAEAIEVSHEKIVDLAEDLLPFEAQEGLP
jgi:hypothetical protein